MSEPTDEQMKEFLFIPIEEQASLSSDTALKDRPVTEMHQTMVVTLLEEEAKKMDKALSRHHMMKIDEYSQTMANFPLPCMRHPQFFYPVAEFKYMVKNELD